LNRGLAGTAQRNDQMLDIVAIQDTLDGFDLAGHAGYDNPIPDLLEIIF
jgi:hypothetical protein